MCGVERKRPLGRSKVRWEFNVEVDVKTIEGGVVDWIHLVQDSNKWRAVVVQYGNEPPRSAKCLKFLH